MKRLSICCLWLQHSLTTQHKLGVTPSTLVNCINSLIHSPFQQNSLLFSSLPPFFFLSNFSFYLSSSTIFFFFIHAACYRCSQIFARIPQSTVVFYVLLSPLGFPIHMLMLPSTSLRTPMPLLCTL